MKANSINQYIILKWVEANFIVSEVDVILVDDNCVEIMDKTLDYLLISVNEDSEIAIEKGCAFDDHSLIINANEKIGDDLI